MFGNKKMKTLSELNQACFSQILDKKEVFEANISQIEMGDKRVGEDLTQVEENTCSIVENAMLNVETESVLLHTIDEYKEMQEKAFADYVHLCEGIKDQMEAGMELVEQNKHFTSPAKYLGEVPSALREKNKSYELHLGEMEECGKKMSVLALNAAIEAGRLGEGGKQFVTVAEEIRQNAISYEKTAATLKEEITESYKQLQELENTIHHMVALLKDSNMGASKLLKKCQHNSKLMQKSAMKDFSEEMDVFRDKVVGLRNLDEEIVKSGERNKLQLTDIGEELQAMKNDLAEIDSDVSYLMDIAQEQLKA